MVLSIVTTCSYMLVPGSCFGAPGISCLRYYRSDDCAGNGILIQNSIPFSQIRLSFPSQHIDSVAVQAYDFTFLSLYIPYPKSFSYRVYSRLEYILIRSTNLLYIDFFLASPSHASMLSWKVLPSTFGSDHFPIIFSMHQQPSSPFNRNPTLKFKIN